MLILSIVVSSLVAVITGSCLGIISGFSIASQKDVLAGFRPNTNNRFLLFVCRPTSELTFVDAILFVLLLVTWLALFVILIVAPAIVALQIDQENELAVRVSLVIVAVFIFISRNIGKNLWDRLM